MNENNSNNQDITFGAKEKLALQQLLTSKALVVDSQSKRDEEIYSKSAVSLADKWNLVPNDISLHEWQKKCLDKWLPSRRGTVKVATGGGKTVFALLAIEKLQNQHEPDLRVVIVVPTIPLMYQWLDELKHSNIPRNYIGMMGGGESFPDDSKIRILICVLNSARERLASVVKKFQWEQKLFLIVDECHKSNASSASKIFDADFQFSLGLSATPETDQFDDGIPVEQHYAESPAGKALGPIIFDFSLKESRDANLLTPFTVNHVGVTLAHDEAVEHSRLSSEISDLRKELQNAHSRSKSSQSFLPWCQTLAKKKGGGDAARFIGLSNERKRLLYRASARTKFILKILCAAMKDQDRRVIVFHESIDEINKLYGKALNLNLPVVLEHSKLPSSLRDENINMFRQGIARTIISAKSLIEGFNVPSADVGIIAASSGSVRQRIQSMGRLLRKKSNGKNATIYVLYVKDTEDEKIYEKADWEAVIGAEANRYFELQQSEIDIQDYSNLNFSDLHRFLKEVDNPPRQYRPPCHEIKSDMLSIDAPYPAQATGIELKVDNEGNLRKNDDSLVKLSQKIVEKIVTINKYKRAMQTPCGHVIVRSSDKKDEQVNWIYVGDANTNANTNANATADISISDPIKLIIKQASGRTVIAKKDGRNESFAKPTETQQALLDWVKDKQRDIDLPIRHLYWDNAHRYWIEIKGECFEFDDKNKPLEF